MTKPTEISEIGKVAAIEKLFENSGYTNKPLISLPEKGECCSAHKILLEGVDFDLTYTPLKHLGYKSVLSVIGEIYVGFHIPVSLQIVIGMSNRFSFEDVRELWDGMLGAAKEHSLKHLSLNLVPSAAGLVISLSSCGVQRRSVLEKVPKAKSFDLICLSGNVGAAYMGLQVLEREKATFNKLGQQPDLSKYKYVLGQYLSPEIKPDVLDRFIEFGITPSYGYLVTHGLGATVKQLAKETGHGAKIYIDKIPISSQTFAMAEEIKMDAITAALNGGDDYRLLFVIPISRHETFRKEFQDYDVIGHLAKQEVGAVLVTPEGAEIDIQAQGF